MTEYHEQRIERILNKLKQVQQRKLSCFGSNTHNFKLNAPIDESELLSFESTHNVTLPADYRCFLKMAGEGGAGPYYGIYKLHEWNDFIDWTSDEVPVNFLAQPCPLHPLMSREKGWETQFANCFSPYQGMISIGSQGCSYMIGLIIKGEYKGRVVYLDADGNSPYIVLEPDFLAWYERWLDELLGNYDMFWFGYGLGGNEATLTALLEDSSTTATDRAEAIHAIRRLPKLSVVGQKTICHFLEDEVPEVRAAVCSVLEKFNISVVQDSLLKLLQDQSEIVQKAAIKACIKLSITDAHNVVTRLLDSGNEAVALQAITTLKEFGKLPREILLRLLETSPHGDVRYNAAFNMKWKREDEQLLIHLLKDDHVQVRKHAVWGLLELKSQATLSALIDLLTKEQDQNLIEWILKMLGEVPGDRNADVLLEWTNSNDDLYRLTAVESLCKIGDIRIKPVAEKMMIEQRSPERRDANGAYLGGRAKTISESVRESLLASPNRRLRCLVSPSHWPFWFTFKNLFKK